GFPPWPFASRQSREGPARGEHGQGDGRRRLRQLHGDRFVRSRLPEGNQPELHRPHESGLRRGVAEGEVIGMPRALNGELGRVTAKTQAQGQESLIWLASPPPSAPNNRARPRFPRLEHSAAVPPLRESKTFFSDLD